MGRDPVHRVPADLRARLAVDGAALDRFPVEGQFDGRIGHDPARNGDVPEAEPEGLGRLAGVAEGGFDPDLARPSEPRFNVMRFSMIRFASGFSSPNPASLGTT